MKFFFTITYLSLSLIVFSQELPDVPIKNGMTYYSFEHKFDNQKKCISNYFGMISTESLAMNTTIGKKSLLVSNEIGSSIRLIFMDPNNVKPNCLDTITSSNQSITIVLNNSKTLKSLPIQGTIRIIFTSKNEYVLQILNLKYNSLYQPKADKNEVFGIAEIYERIQQRGKASNKEIKFFNEINMIAEKIDEIILKSVTEVYRADDL